MKNQKTIWIALSFILCLAGTGHAQETSLTLPTNDGASSFTVKSQNGTNVFKVDGSGQMTGNGSGLSNVKPIVVFSNGDDGVATVNTFSCKPAGVEGFDGVGFAFVEGCIGGLNLYECQTMKTLTINCPGPGTIVAQASGYAMWLSQNQDLVRIWFHPHDTAPYDWQTPDFRNLRILTDYGCTDASDQFATWSISKGYPVSSAGNFTVRIVADKPWSESAVVVSDISMQLMFFPQ